MKKSLSIIIFYDNDSAGSAKLELPALAIYIRHNFGHVKSRRQKRSSHHAYRFCYSGSRPSYIMLSSP